MGIMQISKLLIFSLILSLALLVVQSGMVQALCAPQINTPTECEATTCASSATFATCYSPQSNPYTFTQGAPTIYSPINSLNFYNVISNPYLITCPVGPLLFYENPYSNSYLWFYSNPDSYIAGNECQADSTPISTTVTARATLNYISPSSPPSIDALVDVTDGAQLFINNIGFTPEVDGTLSTAFQTQKNVFEYFPSQYQRAVWSWTAKYANFGNLQPFTVQVSANRLLYKDAVCSYLYDYAATVTFSNFKNTYIPYTEVQGWNDGTPFTFQAKVLPYLVYNARLTNLNSVPNAIPLNLSYDLYSPYQYGLPYLTQIEPTYLDTPPHFFATYQFTDQAAKKAVSILTPYDIDAVSPLNNYRINAYYPQGNIGYDSRDSQTIVSLQGDIADTAALGGMGTGSGSNGCPTGPTGQGYAPGDPTQLKAAEVLACVSAAGFDLTGTTGTGLNAHDSGYIIAALAGLYSNWKPGYIGIYLGPAGQLQDNCLYTGTYSAFLLDPYGRGILGYDACAGPGDLRFNTPGSGTCVYDPSCSFNYAARATTFGGTKGAYLYQDPSTSSTPTYGNPWAVAMEPTGGTGDAPYCKFMPDWASGPNCQLGHGGGDAFWGTKQLTVVSANPGPGSLSGTIPTAKCPDSTDDGKLSFQQVYACAYSVGFRGTQLAIIISIAWYESGFRRDHKSSVILGNTGDNSNLFGYDPDTCKDSGNWQSNPTCDFKWAIYAVQHYINTPVLCHPDGGYSAIDDPSHVFCYWGTYRNIGQEPTGNPEAAYCQAMPNGYTGENCQAGTAYSAHNVNNWDWTSVGLANVPSGYGSTGGGTSSVPTTSGGSLASEGVGINAISIASIPSDYVFVLAQGEILGQIGLQARGGGTAPAPSGGGSGAYTFPVGSGCNGPYPLAPGRTTERIDEGVDWGGSCDLYAIGDGTVVFNGGNGWPGLGAYIAILLKNPLDSQRSVVYYAEDIDQITVKIGDTVTNGEKIGRACYSSCDSRISPYGIEIGWACPNNYGNPLAKSGCAEPWSTGYTEGQITIAGTDFREFICSLLPNCTTPVYASASAGQVRGIGTFAPAQSANESNSSGISSIALAPASQQANGSVNTIYAPDSIHTPTILAGGGGGTIIFTSDQNVPPDLIAVYTLKSISHGLYNSSIIPPTSMDKFETSADQWDPIWSSYWSKVQLFQDHEMYVINANYIKPEKLEPIAHLEKEGFQYLGFDAYNITADDYGDTFITGSVTMIYSNFMGGVPVKFPMIIRVGNTISKYPTITSSFVEDSFVKDCDVNNNCKILQNDFKEIAASPTGKLLYLADSNPRQKYRNWFIRPYDGNTLAPAGQKFDLAYSNDAPGGSNINVNTACNHGFFDSKRVNKPTINLSDYFYRGGFFGINASAAFTNGPQDTPQARQLFTILNPNIGTPQSLGDWGSNMGDTRADADQLDRDCWHTPLGIQDVNGYLYVLDDWHGRFGEDCKFSLAVIGSSDESGCDRGVIFNIVTLRVLNSNGIDVPINPTTFNDLWTGEAHPLPAGIPSPPGLYRYPVPPDQTKFPPYGWQLTATISAGTTTGQNLALCSGGGTYFEERKPKHSYKCELPALSAAVATAPVPTTASQVVCFERDPPVHGIISTTDPKKTIDTLCKKDVNPQDDPQTQLRYGYQPLMPYINPWTCDADSIVGFSLSTSCQSTTMRGISFSVSYNGTVSILVPTSTEPLTTENIKPAPTDQLDTDDPTHAGHTGNVNNELLFLRLNPENYTQTISQTGPSPRLYYACYTSVQQDAMLLEGGGEGGLCHFDANIENLANQHLFNHAIYEMDDPFAFLQGVGSLRPLTFEGFYYSTFSGPTSSSSGPSSNPKLDKAILDNLASQQFKTSANIEFKTTAGQPTFSVVDITNINSIISGNVLVPFSYSYNVHSSVSNQQTLDLPGHGPGPCPGVPTPPDQPGTVYSYASQDGNSNYHTANIEGGPTYAQYVANQSLFQQNTLPITLPPQIVYDVVSNRRFGAEYINSTLDPNFDNVLNPDLIPQYLINATQQLNYQPLTITQGSYPGYETISTVALRPPCYNPTCAPPLAGSATPGQLPPGDIIDKFNNFTYISENIPGFVALFNWNRLFPYSAISYLNFNGVLNVKREVFGYHRLIFAYNDRFNNTHFQPIDADIANLTAITLQIYPNVNPTNTNQTSLTINGVASYTPPFSPTPVPLKNSDIYLYYDKDINYVGINPTTKDGIIQAQLCTFGDGSPSGKVTMPDNCATSDPHYIPNQDSDVGTIEYAPQYSLASAGTQCIPPPNSLLAKAPYDCNIYGYDGKTNIKALCPSQNVGPAQPLGAQEYCVPQWANGTGYCTAQIGLMDIVTTNAIGAFTFNTVACGAGYHTILAAFYGVGDNPADGTPSDQPLSLAEPPIQYAYNPVASRATEMPFSANSYTWAPAVSVETIAIGSYLVNYGTISAIGLVAGITIIAAIWLAKSAYHMIKPEKHINKRKR